jgi:hypothetical protein
MTCEMLHTTPATTSAPSRPASLETLSATHQFFSRPGSEQGRQEVLDLPPSTFATHGTIHAVVKLCLSHAHGDPLERACQRATSSRNSGI